MRRLTAGLACAAMLWALSGCADPARRPAPAAGEPVATTTEPARPRPVVAGRPGAQPGRRLELAVYYLRSFAGRRYLAPERHAVPWTRAVAAAALGELLGGRPRSPGARRPFPPGTRLRGVRLRQGTATVDLSGAALRVLPGPDRRWSLQALVHTATQFPTVERVVVRVQGRVLAGPLARDPAVPLAPIALFEPAAGAMVRGERLVVRGEASVYEGTVNLRLRDERGRVVAQSHATAARGAPGRGPFTGALVLTPPPAPRPWTLEAFEVSPEDGRIRYAVRLPVWVCR